MASCHFCKKEIQRAEANKMVTCVKRPDGQLAYNIPSEGKKASGKLVWCAHYKHFKVAEKRENRGGDAVTGRGMGDIPTAYTIGALTANQDELALLGITEEQAKTLNTRDLSDRVASARKQAIAQGTGDGDWREKERTRALEHGGPYKHDHVARVEGFRLPSHLEHAHGVEAQEIVGQSVASLTVRHSEEHAKQSLKATQESRSEDPGYKDPGLGDSDWRHQEIRDIDELPVPDQARGQ